VQREKREDTWRLLKARECVDWAQALMDKTSVEGVDKEGGNVTVVAGCAYTGDAELIAKAPALMEEMLEYIEELERKNSKYTRRYMRIVEHLVKVAGPEGKIFLCDICDEMVSGVTVDQGHTSCIACAEAQAEFDGKEAQYEAESYHK